MDDSPIGRFVHGLAKFVALAGGAVLVVIVVVPTVTADANFVFNEVVGDFQEITLQGQFTYRINDPERAAELLNFTIDPVSRAYVVDPAERVLQRIANVIAG